MAQISFDQLSPRVGKSDLLRLLDQTGGLSGTRVGKIALSGGRATVEVPSGWEGRLAKALDGAVLHGRRISVWAEGTAGDDPRREHLQKLVRLIDIERAAEADRAVELSRRLSAADAERAGHALVDLVIEDEEAGLGGYYLVKLIKRNRRPLPWTRLQLGSPVVMTSMGEAHVAARGVVYDRREHALYVALGQLPEAAEDVEHWRLDLSSDEISSQRQRSAVERVLRARGDRLAQLRDVLLGLAEPRFDDPPATTATLDQNLNTQQRETAAFALAARDVALIHGPPGTGKTTTVVEVIRQAVERGQKVLACGPSNMAVDNIFERLLRFDVRGVRLGHPARVMPELRDHTLDSLVEKHADVRLARQLVKDAFALFRRAARTTRARPEPGARRDQRAEARTLLADARRLEAQAVEHILDTADVLCATTTGLDDNLLGDRRFDLVVIDEACQSTEPGCWIAIARADRVVLAGDHRQLPPTVLSADAQRQGYAVSLFERLAEAQPALLRRVETQYRMHESIMEFSSFEFYDAELVADPSVAGHRLVDLPDVSANALTESPFEFIDTAGAGFDEVTEAEGQSRLNPQEAELVARRVRALLDAGVSAEQIGVITPYAAQARLLREKLDEPNLEIDTVDGFQGREKEAIIISLVRSNVTGEVGFLADIRRMNVAMTRARRKLIVIGDSATLSSEPFYARLVAHCEATGAYHTVWEEDGLL